MNRILSQFILPFKDIPYLPRWIILLIDILISMFAFTVSYLICYDLLGVSIIIPAFLMKLLLNTVVCTLFYLIFKTYSGIIRYSTFADALRVFYAVLCSNLVMIIIDFLLTRFYNRSVFLNIGFFINATLTFALMFSSRMFVRLIHDYFKNDFLINNKKKPLLIYGLNSNTVAVARMIKADSAINYRLVGFISTNSNAADKTIMGVPVYHKQEQYLDILKENKVQTLLMTPSDLDRKTRQEIVDFCLENNVQVISPPPISEWENGTPRLGEMKSIQIEDLLGRESIQISSELIEEQLHGKCVLVTGAAGSIGSEIVRQISTFHPSLLVLCDCAESPLYSLQLELEEQFPDLKFVAHISNVRAQEQMEQIFATYKPQYIYHAAAYKHVPLMEEQPSEAILTNVFGTKNVADLALKYNAEVFVMISTDKAVNPSNVMGASKRIAEIYIQSMYLYLQKNAQKAGHTKFITTRFGNVLGSNGSVIPRFKEQIAKGGPITVTHPEIIRYFMTIPEACRLVLEAGIMGKGDEIFIFDMGEPVKIADLAKRMIRLAGFVPNKDIQIEFTGLRPGEKLYEELLNQKEYTQPTHHEKIMIAKVREYDYVHVSILLDNLIEVARTYNKTETVKVMKNIVPEFKSLNSVYEILDENDFAEKM